MQVQLVKTLELTCADIGRYEEAAGQLERTLAIQSDAGISGDDKNVLDN